jgi:hypothetical protein
VHRKAIFRAYAKVLEPGDPTMRIHEAGLRGCPGQPGLSLADVLRRTGGVYETTTHLTPQFRADIRVVAELTSDAELLAVADLTEVPVSLDPRHGMGSLREADGEPLTSANVRMRRVPSAGVCGRWLPSVAPPRLECGRALARAACHAHAAGLMISHHLSHHERSDDLSYHADLIGGQPGNEPAFMPAYEAARSWSARNWPRLTSWSANMIRPVQG